MVLHNDERAIEFAGRICAGPTEKFLKKHDGDSDSIMFVIEVNVL